MAYKIKVYRMIGLLFVDDHLGHQFSKCNVWISGSGAVSEDPMKSKLYS